MQDILSKEQKKEEDANIELPLKWETLEYQYIPKSNDWFWYLASAALMLVIAAVFMHNFLLGVIAVIGAFSMAIMGGRKPERIIFSIEIKGIRIDNKLYPYANLNSFWLNYDPPDRKELILESKKALAPRITINTEDVDPNQIRKTLLKFLKEKKQEDTMLDAVENLIGF